MYRSAFLIEMLNKYPLGRLFRARWLVNWKEVSFSFCARPQNIITPSVAATFSRAHGKKHISKVFSLHFVFRVDINKEKNTHHNNQSINFPHFFYRLTILLLLFTVMRVTRHSLHSIMIMERVYSDFLNFINLHIFFFVGWSVCRLRIVICYPFFDSSP